MSKELSVRFDKRNATVYYRQFCLMITENSYAILKNGYAILDNGCAFWRIGAHFGEWICILVIHACADYRLSWPKYVTDSIWHEYTLHYLSSTKQIVLQRRLICIYPFLVPIQQNTSWNCKGIRGVACLKFNKRNCGNVLYAFMHKIPKEGHLQIA